MFLWRLLHNGIASRSNSSKFISEINADCPFCLCAIETRDHLLLHCSFSQAVWFASPLGLHFEDSSITIDTMLRNWIESEFGTEGIQLGASLLWCLWKARNRLVFDKIQPDILKIIDAACTLAKDYSAPFSEDVVDFVPGQNLTSHVRWIPPAPNSIKINVDGAFVFPRYSAAAVARNSEGALLGCITSVSECSSPIEAEAFAFLLGASFASRFHTERVIIEGDAKLVVQAISGTQEDIPWRIQSHISDLRHVLHRDDNLEFVFIKRDANCVAHSLAKFALDFTVSDVWLGPYPPSCLVAPIATDRESGCFDS
ncbi:Reverse transcriptase zinc-binding domain [Macleaya cordata]|nr:Reverse transcriptase zinc-binding domain [Macleaya cordata]